MRFLCLDYETYFDSRNKYSLKTMTTEAYVRDPRFKAHCAGLYDPMRDRRGHCLPEALRALPWSDLAVLHHHAHFDGLILTHQYDIRPAFYFDTLSMSRAARPRAKSHSLAALAAEFGLPEKTVPYNEFDGARNLSPDLLRRLGESAAHDAWLSWEIFKRLLPSVPREELALIDLTVRMFTEPAMRLDRARCREWLDSERVRKSSLLHDAGVTEQDMQSAVRFRAALEAAGAECPMKPSPAHSETLIPAIAASDQGMADLEEHDSPLVRALVSARLGVKSTIGTTRAQRLLDMDTRGPLPAYLNYCGAHTWRWSGGDKMNWQNFPKEGDLKSSVIAPLGHVFVSGDSGQGECRILNYIAGQWDVLDAFARGRDLYCENAAAFYGRAITKADVAERQLGKKMELSCGFGCGGRPRNGRPGRFREMCRNDGLFITDEESTRAVEGVYRPRHKRVVAFWNMCGDKVLPDLHDGLGRDYGVFQVRDHGIYLPNGARLDYRGLYVDTQGGWRLNTRRGQIRLHGPKLTENIVQALHRVQVAQVAGRIGRRERLVMMTHDSLDYLVPVERAEAFKLELHAELVRVPVWMPGIPLGAEVTISERFGK